MTLRASYPAELREPAVRMVFEVTADYPSEWAPINAVASIDSVSTPPTGWVWRIGCWPRGPAESRLHSTSR